MALRVPLAFILGAVVIGGVLWAVGGNRQDWLPAKNRPITTDIEMRDANAAFDDGATASPKGCSHSLFMTRRYVWADAAGDRASVVSAARQLLQVVGHMALALQGNRKLIVPRAHVTHVTNYSFASLPAVIRSLVVVDVCERNFVRAQHMSAYFRSASAPLTVGRYLRALREPTPTALKVRTDTSAVGADVLSSTFRYDGEKGRLLQLRDPRHAAAMKSFVCQYPFHRAVQEVVDAILVNETRSTIGIFSTTPRDSHGLSMPSNDNVSATWAAIAGNADVQAVIERIGRRGSENSIVAVGFGSRDPQHFTPIGGVPAATSLKAIQALLDEATRSGRPISGPPTTRERLLGSLARFPALRSTVDLVLMERLADVVLVEAATPQTLDWLADTAVATVLGARRCCTRRVARMFAVELQRATGRATVAGIREWSCDQQGWVPVKA
jgi:hypothetical protein